MERALTGLANRLAQSRTKSSRDLTQLSSAKEYPADPDAYELLGDCGRGVSATVHRALCKGYGEVVAIKRMNLESLNCDLEEIIHEAQTMKNYHHPNVLPLYCSFVSGQELWMVMPFISGGSVLHIMKYAHPEGLDEVMIATIMRDVLKALEYVHKQGGIHRDIKAGNILLDKDGHVLLGDFGVAASMERSGSWGHDKVARMTFVGTPCWMAPEVMEQTQGYDSSADIWSFGITLLEMAHGHAPFAKFPPMKVLLMTLQNPPPTLDDKGKKHFSKSMREVVTRCLQKDPRMRPTASQLLEHKFFKQARDDEYMAKNLMAGLPTLQDRVQEIRQGKAATNASDNDKNFARSQDEYKKGVSAWNFDLAALKAQAALEPDDEEPTLPTITETDEGHEGTLSGMVASQAAAFLLAQQGQQSGSGAGTGQPQQPQQAQSQQPTANGNSNAANSAFASFHGQQQLLKDGALLPPVQQYGAPEGQATGAPSLPSNADSGAVATHSAPPEAKPGSHQGAESVPLSPGTLSPPGLSRESSVQGPLVALAGSTPTTNKQKTKQLGRFQIYEPGSEPPPMSPGSNAVSASMSVPAEMNLYTKSQPGIAPEQSMPAPLPPRTSEDGIKRAEKSSALDTQESVFEDQITATGEPKKKGRFLVVEQQGLSKVASAASLNDSMVLAGKSRSEAGKDGSGALGKPPPIPTSLPSTPPSAAGVPVATLLPRLVELMEHAAQQQTAVQRLVGALQDLERGKSNMLLSRTQSTRSLFMGGADLGGSSAALGLQRGQQGSGGGDVSEADSDALRHRVSELEAENGRLKARNQQLEALFQQLQLASGGGPGHQLAPAPGGSGPVPDGLLQAHQQQQHQAGSSQPQSAQPGASPNVSPREREEGRS